MGSLRLSKRILRHYTELTIKCLREVEEGEGVRNSLSVCVEGYGGDTEAAEHR